MKQTKSKRKWWWIAIPVVLLVAAGVFLLLPKLLPGAVAGRTNTTLETAKVSKLTVTDQVEASGSVEADQFASLSWKTTGTISKALVKVGDPVKAGDVLFELDPTTAPANIISAQSELINAQKSLDDLLNSRSNQAQALKALEDAQKSFDNRELNLEAQQAQAMLALVKAQEAYDEAEKDRKNLNYNRASQATLDAAEADYLLAVAELEQAQTRFDEVSGRPKDDLVRALAQSNLSLAKQKRDRTLSKLNWYKAPSSEQDIQEADATLAQAKANLSQAQLDWETLKAGLSAADVAVLEARLADAQRTYDLVKNGPNPDDVAALEARIAAAQATLNSLHITAPFDGEILVMNDKIGDVVNTGDVAAILANRKNLYVEVLVDETDISSIQTGSQAKVNVDVLSDVVMEGVVSTINPVGQTIANLVKYAVRVDLQNPPAQMLLGSTADVAIQIGTPSEKLVVPLNAVQNDATGEYVMKQVVEGLPVRVNVTSGEIVGDQVVVNGDLKEGDVLVIMVAPGSQNGFGFMGQ
jgi:HlyD family secretion protein